MKKVAPNARANPKMAEAIKHMSDEPRRGESVSDTLYVCVYIYIVRYNNRAVV